MMLAPSFLKEQVHERTRWIFASVESVLAAKGPHRFTLEGIPFNESDPHIVVTPWLLDETNANAKTVISVNIDSFHDDKIEFRASWMNEDLVSDANVRFDFCITQSAPKKNRLQMPRLN